LALDEFSSITRFRVPLADIDMRQHLNNASYVVWAGAARMAYFEEVLREPEWGNTGFIVAQLVVSYERPLEHQESVAIGCRVTRIGNKSCDFLCEVWSEDANQLAATCLATLIAYDYQTKSSIMIPHKWPELIAAHEVVAPVLGAGEP
jgi:acyl-CoA thioester hydrolase